MLFKKHESQSIRRPCSSADRSKLKSLHFCSMDFAGFEVGEDSASAHKEFHPVYGLEVH